MRSNDDDDHDHTCLISDFLHFCLQIKFIIMLSTRFVWETREVCVIIKQLMEIFYGYLGHW